MGLSRNISAVCIVFLASMIPWIENEPVHLKAAAAELSCNTTQKKTNIQNTPAFTPHTYFGQIEKQVIVEHINSEAAVARRRQSDRIHKPELKKTNLPLRLLGTTTGSNISAYAIIEDTTSGIQKLYRNGDQIQNATIISVFREKVVLKIGDDFAILELETVRPDLNGKYESIGYALIDASFKGQKDIVEQLILEGADLNAQDGQGDTALMKAATKGHVEIVDLLIANGADFNLKDKWGNTAVMDSAKYPRQSACEIINLLKDNGADINATNKFGFTAIMYAALGGQLENIVCLIAEGANVNAKSNSGETALKFAEISDRKDIINLLKENGAIE
jgi:hypothetical protein